MVQADSAVKRQVNEGDPMSATPRLSESHGLPGSDAEPDTTRPPGKRKRGRRNKRGFGRILVLAGLLALCAVAGVDFSRYAHGVATAAIPEPAVADAIVVLTGGQARVSEAIRLLEEGRAGRLLISGVHPGTTREQLALVTASAMPLEESSVDLDRVALNTAGNAVETSNWVRKNGFSSLLVVTSAYHLPRATTELAGALPDVTLVGYPVFARDLRLDAWYRDLATIRLLIREYVKYTVARVRVGLRSMV